MSAAPEFLTVAGRWRQHVKVSGLDKLPKRDQVLAMLMFFVGFSEALEALTALAELPEIEAVQVLSALRREVECLAGMDESMLRKDSH